MKYPEISQKRLKRLEKEIEPKKIIMVLNNEIPEILLAETKKTLTLVALRKKLFYRNILQAMKYE